MKAIKLPLSTVEMIMQMHNSENVLTLYLFYCKTAIEQRTNQPYANVPFCSNVLGWSESKVRGAKRTLRNIDLIEDIPANGRNNKAYVKVNLIQ